jgi:hypothetical protein
VATHKSRFSIAAHTRRVFAKRPLRTACAVVLLYGTTSLGLIRTVGTPPAVVGELTILASVMVSVLGGAVLLRALDEQRDGERRSQVSAAALEHTARARTASRGRSRR